MQKRITVSLVIQLICAVLLVTSFSLPWIEKGLISVSGYKVPKVNEFGTKVSNLAYVFKPSKKSSTKTGYLFYLVPAFCAAAALFMFKKRSRIPKYLIFIACILGLVFSVYFYTSMKFSYIGSGPHMLFITSLAYIIIFFTPLLRIRKDEPVAETIARDENNQNEKI